MNEKLQQIFLMLTNMAIYSFLVLLMSLFIYSLNVYALSTGTGFFITSDGYFVTNYHVIDKAEQIVIKTEDDTYYAKVIAKDPINDLAVIKIKANGLLALPINFDSTVVPGAEVLTVGFPDPNVLGIKPKTTIGIISSLSGIKDDPRFYQTSVQIQPGNSGGPLVNLNGEVIGITTATLDSIRRLKEGGYLPQNVNYAIKVGYLQPLLTTIRGLKLTPLTDSQKNIKYEEVQRKTEQAVGLVIVFHISDTDSSVTNKTPEPPPLPNTKPNPNQNLWVFYDSSERYITDDELRFLTKDELWKARNEIYVRKGYIFTTERGKRFANSFGNLYRPIISSQEATFKAMNNYERANILKIKERESSR